MVWYHFHGAALIWQKIYEVENDEVNMSEWVALKTEKGLKCLEDV